MNHCTDIVPIGRLKWEPGSKYTGKDNCAWYRFAPTLPKHGTRFWPRDREVLGYSKEMMDILG